MLAKIWPTHSKNTSPLLWTISFTLKIWPPLYGKDIHLWRQVPTTSARSKQLRQLHRRCLPICCSDPAVHHREEQGHQEVPWRTLRVREDHHCQGWMRSRWHASPAKWFQVIKACRCLDWEINPLGIYLWFKVFNLWGGRVSFCQRNLFNLNLPSRIYVGGQKCVLWLMVFLWR